MEAKGKSFLKVTGVLMVLFGTVGIVSVIMSFADLKNLIKTYEGLSMDTTLLIPNLVLGTIAAVFEVATGVVGVLFAKKPERAIVNIGIGVVLAMIEIGAGILDLWIVNAEGSGIAASITSMIISLILPVLYVYGGVLNKESN